MRHAAGVSSAEFRCLFLNPHRPVVIHNAYKHGTPVVDVLEPASERRGANGIDARA
jgi:hypothetical protein